MGATLRKEKTFAMMLKTKLHRNLCSRLKTAARIITISCAPLLTFAFDVGMNTPILAAPEKRFQVGDEVEVFSAGEASHGVIVGGYQDSGFGYGKYVVRLQNGYEQDYKADFVRTRFQPDSQKRFKIGDSVEARRWDGTTYKGKVIGADGEKYDVSFQRDGAATHEWIHVYNLRATNAPNVAQPKDKPDAKNGGNKNNQAKRGWPGQRYQVGDRVQYNDPGFTDTATFGTIISVDAQKRMYQIRDEGDASIRYSHPCYAVLKPGEKIDNSFYIGKWQVYTTGALTSAAITGAAKLPPLDIKADGTYVWQQSGGKTIRGKWVPRRGVRGVKLLKGLDGTDWTIYEKTEAYATTAKTRDEIGLSAASGRAGFNALRVGANRSCILTGRFGAGK
jgi:hypothetical protein